jgi:Universal stress protein family
VTGGRRILFPFLGDTLSRAAFDEALRKARSQDAVLVPAYLATVPQHLSLQSPLPQGESEAAIGLLELIEQLAAREGVPVDSRIERGRTPRDALTALLEHERYDTVVAPPDLASLVAPGPSTQHANSATPPETSTS